jgi:hypothetical protein
MRTGDNRGWVGGIERSNEGDMNFHQINWTDPRLLIGIVVVMVLIAVVAALASRARRAKTEALRSRFGPEYERTIREHGRKGEAQLAAREARVNGFKIRQLTVAERERFVAEWEALQMRFVDHPKTAVAEADEVVGSLMAARGYPATSFEQRAEDISVNHPQMVTHYRSAHAVAVRATGTEESTEEMRQAMIHYRALFDELIGEAAQVDIRTGQRTAA